VHGGRAAGEGAPHQELLLGGGGAAQAGGALRAARGGRRASPRPRNRMCTKPMQRCPRVHVWIADAGGGSTADELRLDRIADTLGCRARGLRRFLNMRVKYGKIYQFTEMRLDTRSKATSEAKAQLQVAVLVPRTRDESPAGLRAQIAWNVCDPWSDGCVPVIRLVGAVDLGAVAGAAAECGRRAAAAGAGMALAGRCN